MVCNWLMHGLGAGASYTALVNRILTILFSWPLLAFVVWLSAWLLFVAARLAGAHVAVAWCLALAFSVLASPLGSTRLRRVVVAAGFPLSWLALVGGAVGAHMGWVWLLPLALALLLYPPSAWRDAPLFPTPPHAFDGLADQLKLPLAGHVLDAGCGLGDGLLALERAWPDVHLHGLERSWPLRALCALRCRTAEVRQGDMWRADWSGYDMVYLFQRPESMPQAWAKACAELKPGAWLASLEFPVVGQQPTMEWTCPDGRPLWLYQQKK